MTIFLKRIKAKKIRHLRNVDIPLDDKTRKHLIITGKNGSGKTSLLAEMNVFLQAAQEPGLAYLESQQAAVENAIKRHHLNQGAHPDKSRTSLKNLKLHRQEVKKFGKSELVFTESREAGERIHQGEFLVAFFDAKRTSRVNIPKGISKVALDTKVPTTSRLSEKFLQYIVNAKADRSFARDEGELEEAEKIDEWFVLLTEQLCSIFGAKELELVFDRKNYSFQIKVPEREPFSFNTLSDGYSAVLSIVTELLLRMEAHQSQRKIYDMEGLVLIDEIETHLHVELQKLVLPLLCNFFPKLQFVVTTHSPFVVSSISNAVICDLEKQVIASDLSGYSYDTLIESYFDVDKYSENMKAKLTEFEKLKTQTNELYVADSKRLQELESYFAEVPKYLANELAVKLQQIKLLTLKGRSSD